MTAQSHDHRPNHTRYWANTASGSFPAPLIRTKLLPGSSNRPAEVADRGAVVALNPPGRRAGCPRRDRFDLAIGEVHVRRRSATASAGRVSRLAGTAVIRAKPFENGRSGWTSWAIFHKAASVSPGGRYAP